MNGSRQLKSFASFIPGFKDPVVERIRIRLESKNRNRKRPDKTEINSKERHIKRQAERDE